MSAVPTRRARSLRPPSPRFRWGGQAGYTLLEVLLVVVISALILGPLFMWTLLVIRQQPVQRDTAVRTAQVDLLRTSFVRDATVAGAADDYSAPPEPGTEWHTWREQCISPATVDGRPLVVLISQGNARTKVIYTVAPTQRDGALVADSASLWRTECVANTGELIGARQIVEGIDDDPARTRAVCAAPATKQDGQPDEPCRSIALTVRGQGATRPVQLAATRRTDLGSLDVTPEGNLLPIAAIRVVMRERPMGSPAQQVELHGDQSVDPDGGALTYKWELPTSPGVDTPMVEADGVSVVHTLPDVGDYWVRLTVTDEAQGSNQTYARIRVENRRPTATAQVDPTSVRAGSSMITMSSAGSFDPDGHELSYRWVITSGDPAAEGLAQEFSTPDAIWQVPEWAVGPLSVVLTVSDPLGAQGSTAYNNIAVIAPDAEDPDPGDPGDPDPGDPDPEPGAPIAVFVATHLSGTTVRFDASSSESGDGALRHDWQFDSVLNNATGSGEVIEHHYPGPGTYRVTLSVTDAAGRVARTQQQVEIPGNPAAPTNVRVTNGDLMWDPRPGARRYLVDMRSHSGGCARELRDQVVAASPAPRKALPPSPCSGPGFSAQARVGVEGAVGGPVVWSSWLDITAAGEVVK